MNFTENYLSENGYDYYENAAEDTLVFFVHDEEAPSGEAAIGRRKEAIINLSDDTVNGFSGSHSSEDTAVNIETDAQAYTGKGGNNSTNFDVQQAKPAVDNEYDNASVSGSLSAPDDNREGDDISNNVPRMSQVDEKQTNAQQSRFKN